MNAQHTSEGSLVDPAVTLASDTGADWKSFLDALPDGISIHSADGTTLEINSRACAIYGIQRVDAVGRNCTELFHGDERSCPHERVMATGRSAEVGPTRGLDNGPFRTTVAPMLATGGKILGFIRLTNDITEIIQAREGLLRAERFATLGQMISGVAHDVGTPLSIISGYSEYLLMRTLPESLGHKELTIILNQTRRIADFIKQLLELARPAQARVDAIGLRGFLGETVELVGHHFKKADVKARIEPGAVSPLVYVDAPRLRQAIFNLLMNASQKVGPGGEVAIAIEQPASNGWAVIIISGKRSGGAVYDLPSSFSKLLDFESSGYVPDLGLTLTKEILRELGVMVERGDTAGSIAIRVPTGG